MLKGWIASPRAIRWLACGTLAALLALVIVLAIAWVLFVPAADWLAHHDVGSAKGALLQTARDAARGRLLTLGAGLFAAGALIFTARNFTLSRDGQIADRYTKAITQLGDVKPDVRIGGIYALERVARDSAEDHPTVMEVLSAFIREHSHEPNGHELRQRLRNVYHPARWLRRRLDNWQPSGPREQQRSTPPDIQAALTVIGRRNARRDIQRINLGGADLRGANFSDADFHNAIFQGADLRGAKFFQADLRGAHLPDADLRDAFLDDANLHDANLNSANLRRADLQHANLTRAHLLLAHLQTANLAGADLSGADLSSADLSGAHAFGIDLTAANLRNANFHDTNLCGFPGTELSGVNLARADLTDADFTRAKWLADAPVPDGWELDARSSRLVRARTNSRPT